MPFAWIRYAFRKRHPRAPFCEKHGGGGEPYARPGIPGILGM